MAQLAQLPVNDGAPEQDGDALRRIPRFRQRYFAFLSYSHHDQVIADWLHDELEKFRVPRALQGRLTASGVIPRRLAPIFRDRHELAASHDLGTEIEDALASSQFLIVLCSPDAAKSRWTNAEIETFKRDRPENCILAAIVSGEPFASDIPGREDEECFPPALRQKYDRRGRPTGKRAEPLAADLREEADGRRSGFLKLVAGMLGVGLDDLVHRETTRRHRRLAWLAAASLGGMAITSTLAITAIQSRDAARDQRREAEGLVAFMLGDLKDKLEPIGRLDALDGVGSRVLAYYGKQDMSGLSDAGLLQRSQALSLTAQVAYLRGNTGTAEKLYRQALQGTSEAVRRTPGDPQRLFDHAQNYFYLGEIGRQRGDFGAAELNYREYQRLAGEMVALEPDNLKWRMEVQYAQANLGIALTGQRRFSDAAQQFASALRTIEALASVEPSNSDYQDALSQSLAWLADAEQAQGHFKEAIALRERQISMLARVGRGNSDVTFVQWLIPANQALGFTHAAQGQFDRSIPRLQEAVTIADKLIPVEPGNDRWKRLAASARLDLGKSLLAAGRLDESARSVSGGCELIATAKKPLSAQWRVLRTKCLSTKARIALASRAKVDAVALADQALASARLELGGDMTANRFSLATAYRLVGDVRDATGDKAGAQAAWSSGLSSIPRHVNELPWETYEHRELLRRLGKDAEARTLDQRLSAMGYRRTS